MFNTHSGNVICDGIPDDMEKIMKKRKLSDKVDALLGLTHGLCEYDFWMHANEREG